MLAVGNNQIADEANERDWKHGLRDLCKMGRRWSGGSCCCLDFGYL